MCVWLLWENSARDTHVNLQDHELHQCLKSGPLSINKKDMSSVEAEFKYHLLYYWNGLNCNVGGLTLQASIMSCMNCQKAKNKFWHASLAKNACMPMLESVAWPTKPKICNSACKHAWRNLNLALNVARTHGRIYWLLKSCIIFMCWNYR